MELFSHKGYSGSIETSIEDGVLHGQILCINDLVTYEALTLPDLKQAFVAAVEDYLETCKAAGKEPDKPFNGLFNVRTGNELHRKAFLRAKQDDTTLNGVVVAALNQYLSGQQNEMTNNQAV